MSEIVIERINLNSSERKKVEEFLSHFDLILESDVENTVIAKINDKVVGTCSNAGSILKCFAVDENLQGEGITSKLITFITNIAFDKGIYETFIFTKPNNLCAFRSLSYKDVCITDKVALLEGGMANIKKYVDNMFKKSSLSSGQKAAIVMNCNPFTLGHRYLIEKASKENDEVVVFIVEENRSNFPFEVRINLVKKGTSDLKNVHVIPGGKYIISSATFPSYFLKNEDEKLLGYTSIDANVFGKYIAPVFNINKRYIGTEPNCSVTEKYNNVLMQTLPTYGVETILVERLKIDNKAISASNVRKYIKNQELEKLKNIVPEITYNFLISKEADKIIEKIKRSDSRH